MAEYNIYLDESSEMHTELEFTQGTYRKSTIKLKAWLSDANQLAIAYSENHPELTLTFKDNRLYVEFEDINGLDFSHELV